MRADTFLLGIDLGTTTCRAAIVNLDGCEIATSRLEVTLSYPRPSWAEIDPELWWHGVRQVVREVIAQSGLAAGQVAAVGLSGLMHAPVLLDADGVPVTPAMLWMDQRCAPQCDAIRRELFDTCPGATQPMTTGVTAPKLRWLADERPETLVRARYLLLPKDFIRFRLTGVAGTDVSDAGGTGMFDREKFDWAYEIVRATHLRPELLPTVGASTDRAGTITGEAARQTGLAPGTPVAIGGADTLCTRLGAGRLSAGELCLYLGTAAWLSVVERRDNEGKPVMRGFGATATTGAALRWTRDLLTPLPTDSRADGYGELVDLAEEVPPGAEGLFFLPHLMGERGPQPDPLARGAFVGLTLRHGRPHLVRAILEGTAFQIRRLLDGRMADQRRLGHDLVGGVACGGAARSPLWIQILADVTGLTLRVPAIVEAASLGAAILGGAAAGLLSPDDAQIRMVRVGQVFAPRPDIAARYDAFYHRHCQLDGLLTPWFQDASPELA